MDIEKLETKIKSLLDNFDEKKFIYDLLLAYEQPKASITRLQKGDFNLSKIPGEILWKKNLFFKKETDVDLHSLIDNYKKNSAITKQNPRFIIVTDFHNLLAVDSRTNDTLDIKISELARHCDFFLPWAGMEKSKLQSESPADIKAAERLGRLYDIILEDNPTAYDSDRHTLNIFLSRLLFCFFAEDTDIFNNDQFTNAVASHTAQDGSDMQSYLQKLFKVLNLLERSDYPQFLQDFPYVNGGLFADDFPVPIFSARSRKIIIECGALNWKAINPDIFGSMIQAVVHNDRRGSMGMHYTSVVNIMKVIEPLFLNDFYAQFENAGNDKKKLNKLLDRLYHLRIFDPACGSGNFLIIAYKELCKLEIEIFKQLYGNQTTFRFLSNIHLTQFYGIEIDDFAHETTKLSLWLAEHQMNLAFKEIFGKTRPTLPLQDGGHIICGNATRLDWEEACPKDDGYEIYILGNPPYLGSSVQSKEQKADKVFVFDGILNFKNLDYIACWFLIGSKYIQNSNAQLAFVSTNSISQGEQVAMLWPHIFSMKLEISFAHQSFKWTNNAKGNAGVTCIIVGIMNLFEKPKFLFKNGVSLSVKNINPYLSISNNLIVNKRKNPLATVPIMSYGNKAADGGYLSLTEFERNELLALATEAEHFIKKLIGASEFINDKQRYCLWIENENLEHALSIAGVGTRIEKVRQFRLNSKKKATRENADISHRFTETRYASNNSIIVPSVSSERRLYIPIGFLDGNNIVSNSAFAIYDPPTYIFAVISSRMHMTWVRAVAGRLKTDYRYSSALCYNTFPFPDITKSQKTILEDSVFKVLDEREQHSEKTMAQLYDPDKMPDGLRQAHHEMDLAVERCYRAKLFTSDEKRLEYLFKLYEEMIEAEKKK